MRIAVDAMGGDFAPEVTVEAALDAARGGQAITLVGVPNWIEGILVKLGATAPPTLEIHPAVEVVGMDEKPSRAVVRKKDASVRVCARLVAEGRAAAMVSAGNSGAVMAAGVIEIGCLPDVERPALLSTFPTEAEPVVVLDLGANVTPTAAQMVHFACMGDAYARAVLGRARPTIAVLANGSEEVKGNALTREVDARLRASRLNYQGYCEGGDIFAGHLDVVVTDGFTGNVVLKTLEGFVRATRSLVRSRIEGSLLGTAGALLMTDVIEELKRRFDYEGAGGAPLLGLRHPVVVAHGSSTVYALQSAIRAADALVRARVTDAVAAELAQGGPSVG